jgi:chromosome segregation ATPase
MVATDLRPAAAFSPRARRLVACCLLALAACASDRETTLSRTRRAQELGEMRAERDRLRQELDVLERTNAENTQKVVQVRRSSVTTASEARTELAALAFEVARLQRAEQDVAAARARAQQIEAELQPLRELQTTLRERDQLVAEAQARLARIQAESAATMGVITAHEAELAPRLAAMKTKLATLQQLGVTLAAAEKAIADALEVVQPKPAAAPPAAQPGKK